MSPEPLFADPAAVLTRQALQLRFQNRHALHPIENTLCAFRHLTGDPSEDGDGGLGFRSAEINYRAGAQGLPLPQVPQLPQSLVQLTRLTVLDFAGRKHLRRWAATHGHTCDEAEFQRRWQEQGRLGGAEHHVYYDEATDRWWKRFYFSINSSTLGEYFQRMRLHAALFPSTAYRLEGFAINPKSKALAPIVSQPHIAVDITAPPVSRGEVSAAMALLGCTPLQLRYEGIVDDGYFAYYHAPSGILVYDLHDENVVRMRLTGELAVIDPFISLARQGTWAALKLAEVGIGVPPDDPVS
jgi:hypothetical protein